MLNVKYLAPDPVGSKWSMKVGHREMNPAEQQVFAQPHLWACREQERGWEDLALCLRSSLKTAHQAGRLRRHSLGSPVTPNSLHHTLMSQSPCWDPGAPWALRRPLSPREHTGTTARLARLF